MEEEEFSQEEIERVKRLYNSEESPLSYQIKLSGTFEIVDESYEVTEKDFED